MLQAAREQMNDTGIYRWPPHINMVYPFLPPSAFGEAVAVLTPAVAALEPFNVTLDSLGTFGGRHRGVLYAHPSDPAQLESLRALQAALQAQLPFLDDQQRRGVYTPHLTLAHFPSRDAAEAARDEQLLEWEPVTFGVAANAVHLLCRDGGGGQFRRAATLPLRGSRETRARHRWHLLVRIARRLAFRARTAPPLPAVWDPPRRFESMPEVEATWIREAREAKRKDRRKARRKAKRKPWRSRNSSGPDRHADRTGPPEAK